MTQITITYARDADGVEVALVPVNSRKGIVGCATIERSDLERLDAYGVPRHWYLNSAHGCGYVSFAARAFKGGNQTVARLIVGAGFRKAVRYRDGDRLNLRRSNLYLADGPTAKGKTPVAGSDLDQTHEGPYDDGQ